MSSYTFSIPEYISRYCHEYQLSGFSIGRVTAEHRDRYEVQIDAKSYDAEITGNLRFTAKSREDFPCVGDWVAVLVYEPNLAIINHVLPRATVIGRKGAGPQTDEQIIAANIDVAFIIQAVDRDYNLNRFERYLTICHESGVHPVLILNKTDLIASDELRKLIDEITERIKGIPVIALSNRNKTGFDQLNSLLEKDKTYCLLGSSGVGKSTLLNLLTGKELMETGAIGEQSNRGRHITSHRQLFMLENGASIIDNPGMRGVGLTNNEQGLHITFSAISELSSRCRFVNCTHRHEAGCAVIEAVQNGTVDEQAYQNYLRLEREQAHYEASIADRRRRDKEFGKMMKNYKKDMKRNSF